MNRRIRRMKKLTTEDLLSLAPQIVLLSHEEQLKFIHKHNPYWVMPKGDNNGKNSTSK